MLAGIGGLGNLAAQEQPAVPAEPRMAVWVAPCKPTAEPAVLEAPALQAPTQPSRHREVIADALPDDLPAKQPAIERVLHDERDGELWAMGRNFKFALRENQTIFVPYFGADAPRNFPVSLGLERVRRGRTTTDLTRAATLHRDGDRLQRQRAGIREVFDLTLDHVEQSFVFDRDEGSGDLVVEQRVHSELQACQVADGIEFRGACGVVGYRSAVVFDSGGKRLSLPIGLDGTCIRLMVPESFLATAQWPITLDPVITVTTVSAGSSIDFAPDIANDGGGLPVLVWHRVWSSTDNDCFVTWTSSGAVQAIDFTSENWVGAKIAHDGARALVVAVVGQPWLQRVVKGRITTPSAVSGAAFQINGPEPGAAVDCDVGAEPSGGQFCVVWEREVTSTDHDILFRLVVATNQFIGGSLAVDNTIGSFDSRPRIGSTCGTGASPPRFWPVVWQRRFSATDEDIRGAGITPSGTMYMPSFSLDFSGANDTNPVASSPSLAFSTPRLFAVCYERQMGVGGHDIHGQVLRAATSVSGVRNFSQLGDAANANAMDQVMPAVECDGVRFVVAHVERDPVVTTGTNQVRISSYALSASASPMESRVLLSPQSTMPVHTRPQVAHLGGTRFGVGTETVAFSPSDRDVHRFTFDANAGRRPWYAPACIQLPWYPVSISVNGTPIELAPPVTAGSTVDFFISSGGYNRWMLVGALLPVPIPMCPTCVWLVDPGTAQWTAGVSALVTIPADPNLIGTTLAVQMLQSDLPGYPNSCPFPFLQSVTAAGVVPIN